MTSCLALAQDKVNISVAIIPMAQDFGWSPTVAGLVQSSFFYGAPLLSSAALCARQVSGVTCRRSSAAAQLVMQRQQTLQREMCVPM